MDTLPLPKLAAYLSTSMAEQNHQITEAIIRESDRLGNFIRQRVPDPGEAEDILQDVFFSFVEAYRLPASIEQVGAWLFRVARNRIIDRFRKKREEPLLLTSEVSEDGEENYWLEQTLPSLASGPEAAYVRERMLEAISSAIAELPEKQREVFIAHELDGRSFKDMAAESGANLNTLLGQKRQAVLYLRARLQPIYDELT